MSVAAVAKEWAKGWPKLAQLQKAVQTNPAYVHRKFSSDKVTSFYIPVALSAAAVSTMVPGLLKMYLGIGKLEGAP